MKKIKHVFGNIIYVLKILWKTSKPAFFIQIFIGIISGVIAPLTVLLTKYIVDAVTQTNPEFKNIMSILLIYFLIQFIPNMIFPWMNSLYNPIRGLKFTGKMNNLMLKKIKNIDLRCFENYIFYDQYTRAISEADNRSNSVFNSFNNFISSFISVLSIVSIIIILDPFILYVSIALVFINFVFDIIMNNVNYKMNMEFTPCQRKHSYVKRIFYQPQFAKDIKLNRKFSDIFIGMYNDAVKNMKELSIKYGKKVAVIYCIKYAANDLFNLGIMIYLCYMTVFKGMVIGTFVSLQNSSSQFMNGLSGFLSSFSDFYNQSLYIDNLRVILEYNPDIENEEGEKLNTDKGIDIDIRNVSFKYENSIDNVLKDINININNGEKIAIVGHNGAGKSTLVKLIARLYDCTEGEININGKNVKDYNVHSLRDNISMVFQDFNTYGISVAQSILIKDNISQEDKKIVWDCLQKVGLKEKVESLPNQLDTILSTEFEGGVNFSGGEQQKLAAAAAFAKNTSLLIFDEPSSQLDPISEYKLYKNIYELSENKTTIMISHRLSSVIDADKIYYMENGEIAEVGSHEELMKVNGKYAKMFRLQSESYSTGIRIKDIFM